MKVLIVDDEAHVIRSIKLLVPWEQLGIDETLDAGNAQDAISIIEMKHPEILITDIVMNDLTGLDLMEYINQRQLKMKIIVISGYNDFDYVRSSLRHGGIDYLLKPLDRQQLISALEKAVTEWIKDDRIEQENRVHREKVFSMTEICRENLLLKIMQQNQLKDAYTELCRITPEFISPTSYLVGYCSLAHFDRGDNGDLFIKRQAYWTALENMLGAFPLGTLIPVGTDSKVQVLFLQLTDQTIRDFQARLPMVSAALPFPCRIGLAVCDDFPGGLKEAYQRAQTAFYQIPASDLISGVRMYEPALNSSGIVHNEDLETHLLSALLTGNETYIDSSIRQWMEQLFTTVAPSLGYILAVIERENHLLTTWAKSFEKRYEGFEHQASYQFMTYAAVSDHNYLFSPELFKNKIKLDMFFLYRELKRILSPGSDVIFQIAHYIEINYDKPFSQFACAQLFFMNKEYMCRRFKQIYRISMIQYLNQVRIDHAKELMKNPNLKIWQIAHKVGFEDEKYFSRQFKKLSQMSPADYRQTIQ